MANAVIDQTIQTVTEADTVIDGAVVFINSVPTLIQNAVSQALSNGATAAELQPLTQLSTDLKSKSDALKAALLANTPTP